MVPISAQRHLWYQYQHRATYGTNTSITPLTDQVPVEQILATVTVTDSIAPWGGICINPLHPHHDHIRSGPPAANGRYQNTGSVAPRDPFHQLLVW